MRTIADHIGVGSLFASLTAIALATLASVASAAETPPADQIAGSCLLAAENQKSRVRPDTDFYANMTELEKYWGSRLEALVPDAAKRVDLLNSGRKAVDYQLSRMSYTDGMFYVGSILGKCREERERLAKNPTGQQ